MKRATILRPDKTTLCEFDLPDSLREVALPRLIDFIVESRGLQNEEKSAVACMTRAVSAFYGIPQETLFDAAAGMNLGADSFAGSVSALYAHATKLIADFKPELPAVEGGKSFYYKGDKYTIPPILEQAIAGEFILPDLTVGEVIEVSELSRFREQTMKARADKDGALRAKFDKIAREKVEALGRNPDTATVQAIDDAARQAYREQVEIEGDPDGSLMFTYYLKLLAVLTRREGEQLPVEDSTREHWVQNRAAHFQDIDAATALDVDFFLTGTSRYSGSAPPAGGFLKSLCFAAVAETRLKSAKRSSGRRSTRKRYSARSGGGR
jgi:hypothetical protein